MNPDIAKERANATIDVEQMKQFIGKLVYFTNEKYQKALVTREELMKRIRPLYYENFSNLTRLEKYNVVFNKTIQLLEWIEDNNIDEELMQYHTLGSLLGNEKPLFNLHVTMFRDSLQVWGTEEQGKHWKKLIDQNGIFGTYVQTELGHGTYLKGLETTATYDKTTKEFIINSPTLTSTKFWPGASGKSCNFAIVIAKLVIDGQEHGLHGFVVQLRSLETHRLLDGIETGDIGKKYGFEATDNGYLRFNKIRIPRFNMLMRFAQVTEDGQFERTGNELLMYSSMLLMRGGLALLGSYFIQQSTIIAIRYSSVRRQTSTTDDKIESQILDYQTQQYRLFPSLAATFAFSFSGWTIRQYLLSCKKKTNNFESIEPMDLAKLHALTSGLKAIIFGESLKFAQTNRVCCGGHGYSASSGLPQIIQDLDAGCSYEGDNVVLLLQVARYLLKCAQNSISPHVVLDEDDGMKIKESKNYKRIEKYIQIYEAYFEEASSEITSKMYTLVKEKGVAPLTAWNESSQQLINLARVFIELFIINANLYTINGQTNQSNSEALMDLLELYILYGICDQHTGNILKLNATNASTINECRDRLLALLPKIRVNAVALVDSFDLLDTSLNSSLGVYNGNVYEKLFEFAKNSQFNQHDVIGAYDKYLKPFFGRYVEKSNI